jgi:hypothetical protein
LNRFSYCGNNPLKYVDPSGHDPLGFKQLGRQFLQGALAQTAYNALWWNPGARQALAVREDEPTAMMVGRHAGNLLSIASGVQGVQAGGTLMEMGLGAMVGGLLAEGATAGQGTAVVVVVEAGSAVAVVVGGVLVIVSAGTAVSGVIEETGMLGRLMAAKRGSQSWNDYGDAPDPGRLKKLTAKEVRKYGLEPLKQEEGVPPNADLYKDPFTGDVYYQVKVGPFQHFLHVPELKTR